MDLGCSSNSAECAINERRKHEVPRELRGHSPPGNFENWDSRLGGNASKVVNTQKSGRIFTSDEWPVNVEEKKIDCI